MCENSDYKINISGINKDELLYELWNNATIVGFYVVNPQINVPIWNLELAKKQVSRDGYADYILGRCIKTNIFKDDNVETYLYDINNGGKGTFERIVNELRSKK